jgi:hypothetical protein
MVIENPLPPFLEWIGPAALDWVIVAALVALIAGAGAYLVVALRYGPVTGFGIARRTLVDAAIDVVGISPRRIWALGLLGVKESISRRILWVFAIFVVALAFAGWFIDRTSTEPARLYLDGVLSRTSFLVLVLMLILSAFSLPADLKSKTLHTVVTKPVRMSELVLGRALGFVLVGTGLLAVMSAISYVFVIRGVAHTHELAAENLRKPEVGLASQAAGLVGYTESTNLFPHRHRVYVDPQGTVNVEPEYGHTHPAEAVQGAKGVTYVLGNQEGMLQARVPIYGKLRFRDTAGLDTDKGINVGDEWMYRSYIQGGTRAAAIWTFEKVREADFPDGIPVEMNIGVFRTHKGNIEKGVTGGLAVRNPKTGLWVEVEIFESKEFTPKRLEIPRKIPNRRNAQMIESKATVVNVTELSPPEVDERLARKEGDFDLFEDLVADGKLEIWLRCVDPGQYFGAGMPDLYLRADDASFTLNFFKGYLGIWLQMALVVGFGVMFSTFLSGPVAALATVGTLLGGYFREFVSQLAQHKVYGGGPFEAFYRLVTQENLITELEPGLQTEVTRMADTVAEFLLRAVASILPPFGDFSYAANVSNGFNVLADPYILVPVVRAIGYLLPVLLAGYFFLKTREVAR